MISKNVTMHIVFIFVLLASCTYVYEFTQNINGDSSEKSAFSSWFYCLVALVFLFGIDRNKKFSEYSDRIKSLNFLLVLTPAVTATLDVYKEHIINFILWQGFQQTGAVVISIVCTAILLILIVFIKKFFDKHGW